MTHVPGKFVWFEHVSNDVTKARAFYGELFGWKSDGVPMGAETYHMIQAGPAAIGGFRTAMAGTPNHWMSYLSVADVDASAAAATGAGGKILMPPTDFGAVGRGATLADPTGAVFSIWKGTEGDRPDGETVAPGDWYWNECVTPDADRAVAFYVRVFGFRHETMDMGQGPYHVLKTGDIPRGGVMKSPDAKAPAGWLPYVSVADCDKSLERARSLGATVCVPAMDLADVGRFAVLADPLGATIGVIRGKFTA